MVQTELKPGTVKSVGTNTFSQNYVKLFFKSAFHVCRHYFCCTINIQIDIIKWSIHWKFLKSAFFFYFATKFGKWFFDKHIEVIYGTYSIKQEWRRLMYCKHCSISNLLPFFSVITVTQHVQNIPFIQFGKIRQIILVLKQFTDVTRDYFSAYQSELWNSCWFLNFWAI